MMSGGVTTHEKSKIFLCKRKENPYCDEPLVKSSICWNIVSVEYMCVRLWPCCGLLLFGTHRKTGPMRFQCGNFDGAIETGVQNKVITKQKLFSI